VFKTIRNILWPMLGPWLLRERWAGQEERVSAIVDDLGAGRDWTFRLRTDPSGRWKDLPFLESCPGSEEGSCGRDLRGIKLKNVALTNCSDLSDAFLDYATLEGVAIDGGSWRGASLRRVRCSGGCVFRRVNFELADLSHARLSDSSFVGSLFRQTDIRGSDFTASVLDNVTVESVDMTCRKSWRISSWWAKTRLPIDPERLARIDLSHVDRKTLWTFEEAESYAILRLRFPVFARFWKLLADAGRAPFRLFLWAILTWMTFGWIYAGLPLPRFGRAAEIGLIERFRPKMVFGDNSDKVRMSDFTPYYFSAVTLTTLGFGDIHPDLSDWRAEAYVTVEVFTGYVFLSLFVALFFQRASWRAAPRQVRDYDKFESVEADIGDVETSLDE
jgi:hypothetical protein